MNDLSADTGRGGANATTIQDFEALAHHADETSRRKLLRSIFDMFYAGGRDVGKEAVVVKFAEVVARLLKDLGDAERADFAATIACDARTPREVTFELALDAETVASPIIRNAPNLTEDDLIAIATLRGTGHRVAIGQRPNVTARVTDVLVDFGETQVMSAILSNETAQTSERTLRIIAERAETVAELREQLCFRKNAPREIIEKLMPLLPAELQQRAVQVISGDSATMQTLADAASRELAIDKGEQARHRLEIKGMAAEVARGARPMHDLLELCIRSERPLDLALGLSLVSNLPEPQCANAVISINFLPLALLCKSLDIDEITYRRIDAMRRISVHLPAKVPESLVEDYRALDIESSRRAMRFVSVQSKMMA